GVSDKLAVTGQAMLGGTFIPDYSVTGYNPNPTAGQYTDAFEGLRANGGVSGTFSAYEDVHYDPNKLLRWEPYYNPNDGMLEWVQYAFTNRPNLTPNQDSVAHVLNKELGLPDAATSGTKLPYNSSTGPALDAHPRMGPGIIFLNNEPLANLPHDF